LIILDYIHDSWNDHFIQMKLFYLESTSFHVTIVKTRRGSLSLMQYLFMHPVH